MLNRIINYIHNLIPFTGITLKVLKADINAKLPTKAHTGMYGDAAYDLYATETITLEPNQRLLVNSGICFLIPNNYWVKLRERSGLANKGIHLLGGVIDSGYTDCIKVILYNSSNSTISITPDKAICQFTIERVLTSQVVEVSQDLFSREASLRKRGTKGFGSSDVKK